MTTRKIRLRQLASGVVLLIAFIASVATSNAPPMVTPTSPSARILVDSAHGLASQLFVVSVPAEAVPDLYYSPQGWNATVVVEKASAQASDGAPVDPASAVRLRVVAVSAENEQGDATPTPGRVPGTAFSDQWTVPTDPNTRVELPLTCETAGPCTRAFRLLATLISNASRVEVDWHVATRLVWKGKAYPSGVTASVRIDDPVAVAGPAPSLDVATNLESITLSADRPAAVRRVQLRLAASAETSYLPAGTMEVITSVAAGPVEKPIVSILDVSSPTPPGSDAPGTFARPSPFPESGDPFSGCSRVADCIRTYVVTVAWQSGNPVTFNWELVVHRTDLAKVIGEKSSPVTLAVTGALDPIGPPVTLHIEGDATHVYSRSDKEQAPILLRVLTERTGAPSADSSQPAIPIDAELADFLPIPGSLKLAIRYTQSPPGVGNLSIGIRASRPDNYGRSLGSALVNLPLVGNPFLYCHASDDCPKLNFETSISYANPSGWQEQPSPGTFQVHWTLDVSVYSYPGLHYVVEQVPIPVASPTAR